MNRPHLTPEQFLGAHGFIWHTLDRHTLVSAFLHEMDEGLAGRASSLGMLPSYVSPTGEIQRGKRVRVLDAGGTNLRGATVMFPTAGDAQITHIEKESMPGIDSYVSPDDFYATFARHLTRTAPFADIPDVGFCFSYACRTASNGDGQLLYWTKQIQAPEIVGQWVGAELLKRLEPKPPRILVLNDTVTTLLTGKAMETQSHSTYVGFILGTGTNVAYVEKNKNIGKITDAPPDGAMIINAESGGFSKIAQSDFDLAMDRKTHDCGHQVFEKMISGAYLGRIALEILRSAAKEGYFSSKTASALQSLKTITSIDLDVFCSGAPTEENPLAHLFTETAERALAQRLTIPVFERAAILTAIHLAAFILKTGGGTEQTKRVCVCIDGSTYYKVKTVCFPKVVKRELDAMLMPRNVFFELMACPNEAPLVGAAAATLLK